MIKKHEILPVHPGIVLLEEFLMPAKKDLAQFAKDIHVDVQQLQKMSRGEEDLTPEIAKKIAVFFKTSLDFWLGLQKDYESDMAKLGSRQKLKKSLYVLNGHAKSKVLPAKCFPAKPQSSSGPRRREQA